MGRRLNQTYRTGVLSEDTDTPVWIFAVAGFLLGFGFWCMGHHIVSLPWATA